MSDAQPNWPVVPLSGLLRRAPRYGINAAAVEFSIVDYDYIRITDIDQDGRFTPHPKVSVRHPSAGSYVLAIGELVFARTGASVGKSYLYDPRDGKLVYAGFLINIAPDTHLLNPKYLSLVAQTQSYWDWVARTSVRSGQPGINSREYAQMLIQLPDIQTQNVIALAATDADELIAALVRLITKKQEIKQGMMQQLLTGRIRLPGFADQWSEAQLGDVLTVKHGKSQKAIESLSGRYPILATGGEIGRTNTALYSKPSVLIGRKGTIDRPQYQATPFWTVDTLFYTEISAVADPKFLYYVFTTIDWRSMNEASGVPSLSSSRVEGVPVSLPSLQEQRAIRQVIDDAEVEIAVLLGRLTKTKVVKRGMMQELLTGRTRLPVEEGAA